LKRLALDEVWWLVSPQNPLKSESGMAPLAERLAAARTFANAPESGERRIVVTDIERELDTRYTVDTLGALKRRFPAIRFVWLMGADNLLQVPRWRNWRALFRAVPVAIFPRPTYSIRALAGKAAQRFARHRIREFRAPSLADMRPPAWVFLHAENDPQSATRIRAQRHADAHD
jgi:nicotinate-nucleotide adenylyltransferase